MIDNFLQFQTNFAEENLQPNLRPPYTLGHGTDDWYYRAYCIIAAVVCLFTIRFCILYWYIESTVYWVSSEKLFHSDWTERDRHILKSRTNNLLEKKPSIGSIDGRVTNELFGWFNKARSLEILSASGLFALLFFCNFSPVLFCTLSDGR